jgi:hypothetical protein
MPELETPITAGAQYQTTDGNHRRIKSLWVDEDKTTWVQVYDEDAGDTAGPKVQHHESIMLSIIIQRITSGEWKRTNSDHQAWEWRQDNPR